MNPEKDTMQLVKERFATLPQEVKDAITASDLKQKMRAVGDKYNLTLDKQGDLQRIILVVMLGILPSTSFVPSLTKDLEINATMANLIAKDVSDQIFAPIRTHLREWEEIARHEAEKAATNLVQETPTDLERAGDFTIDHTQTAGNDTTDEGYVENRPEILENIENPQPATRTYVTNTRETHTEPLIDHLLTTPVTIPPQSITQSAKIIPATPIQRTSPDPYKEPFN